MTPTSPLGGVLIGLLDASVVVLAVLLVVTLVNRRQRNTANPLAGTALDDKLAGAHESADPTPSEHDLRHAA